MGLTAESTLLVASVAAAAEADVRAIPDAALEGFPLVEIRLDGFRSLPDLGALREALPGRELLATLRSREEGGRFSGSREEAAGVLRLALDAGFDLVDVEASDGDLRGLPPARAVASYHDLSGVPASLGSLAETMGRTGARFVKIVATARDSRDALQLLEFQRSHADGRLTAFAMGEAGLATRALAPYFGAALSYGSVARGRETAPGQVPAEDLRDVYGIGRRREVERLFALFGGFVSHSLSPALHNGNFEALAEGALYVPFALGSLLHEFDPLVLAFDRMGLPLRGASVTIPFKEEAATVAVFRGDSVANTLVRSGDTWVASNTDRTALAAFVPLAVPGSRALVLGAGGTARVAIDVLVSRRYDVHVWNRNPVRAHELAEETGASFLANLVAVEESFEVLVNATPVGMKGDDPLPCPQRLLHEGLTVVDAPYGTVETRLCRLARERGATVHDGFSLLVSQAARQAELFTNRATRAEDLLRRLPSRFRTLFDEVTP